LRTTTRNFDPDEAGQAEELANQDLQELPQRLGFSVTDCVVQLSLDTDEAGYRRKLRNTHHTVEVENAELAHVMPYVEAGDVGMLALYVAKHRDQSAAVVELLMARDHERGQQLIDAMKVVFSNGDSEDDFDLERARTKIVSTIADEISGDHLGPSKLSLARGPGGRLRGTLLGGRADSEGEADGARGRDPGDGRSAESAPPDPDAG
jgi:hypothetical protein